MNFGTAKTKALKLMAEYSVNGVVISSTDGNQLDYTLRFADFADDAQKEISKIRRINAVKQFSRNPIPNQLGVNIGFDILQYLGTDNTTTTATGSKAYYFEVDGVATIYVEEETSTGVWSVLTTISHTTPKGEFTVYKGLITASDVTNNIRVRFSGSYPYNIRNRALYAYTFPTTDDIPDYIPYVRYTMPTDFIMLKKVVHRTDPRQYRNLGDFQWEGKKTFVVNYDFTGSFDVYYYKQPTTIASDATDSVEFEIDEEAQDPIPYYMASFAIREENEGAANTLFAIYQNKLSNLPTSVAEGSHMVENSLFSNSPSTKLF
ncbi:MAG: hypothetical protein JM58_09465 [Peptococcaceae bacterium BICA1-8]|nr:MAG: hypothetical protein JM58_09465 [Peptococcaceae bacterium BICA1-8]